MSHGKTVIRPLMWSDKDPGDDNRLKNEHLGYANLDVDIDYVAGTIAFSDEEGGETRVRFEHIPQLANAITTLASRVTIQD